MNLPIPPAPFPDKPLRGGKGEPAARSRRVTPEAPICPTPGAEHRAASVTGSPFPPRRGLSGKGAGGIGLLAALLTLAGPAFAAPPVVKGAAVKPAPDPAALVAAGKLPAFFDPNDLSKGPVLSAKSALLMDADTGQVLWEHDGRVRRFPASTTKILTGLLFAEHTEPDDVITVTDPKITRIEASSLHLKPWEKLSARDLLYGTMLRSANDGSVVIAQHVAGSVSKFAAMMNARAKELGAFHTHFTNPNGLPDPNHYTTAYDLAMIARGALENERFRDSVSKPRRVIERSKNKRDRIVATKGKKFYQKFPGADGIKTGYTRAAGYCFVGSATRDGRRLLAVILGARNAAIDDTIPLLSWGFQRFPPVWVARKGDVVGTVEVRGGAPGKVAVSAAKSLHVTAMDEANPAWTTEIHGEAEAPIARGQEVGRLVVKVDGVPVNSAPVVATEDVARSAVAAVVEGARPMGWLFAGAGILAVGVWRGTTAAKSARRRRRRLAAAGRGVDRGRPGGGGRPDRVYPRYEGRPRDAAHHARRRPGRPAL